jgi:predicted membrane metal-binding protein
VVAAGLATVAAQISTVPVTLYHFQRISIAGFFANLILVANPLRVPVQAAKG